MKLKHIFFICLAPILFIRCLDEINIENDIIVENQIAIIGTLKKGTSSKVEVFVSRLSNLRGINQPLSITNAEIILFFENGAEALLNNLGDGYYELDFPENHPDFNVETPIDHCTAIPTPPEKTCYINIKVNLDKLVVFSGKNRSTDILNQYRLFQGNANHRFAIGYNMRVVQKSISDDAYVYLKNTNELLQRIGGILENPVGKIESNFTNINNPEEEVFGFFYATEQDTMRIHISPEDVNSPNRLCPEICYPGDLLCPIFDEECCDCLLATGSTLTKPDWWQ